jgi:hypothetical protein
MTKVERGRERLIVSLHLFVVCFPKDNKEGDFPFRVVSALPQIRFVKRAAIETRRWCAHFVVAHNLCLWALKSVQTEKGNSYIYTPCWTTWKSLNKLSRNDCRNSTVNYYTSQRPALVTTIAFAPLTFRNELYILPETTL